MIKTLFRWSTSTTSCKMSRISQWVVISLYLTSKKATWLKHLGTRNTSKIRSSRLSTVGYWSRAIRRGCTQPAQATNQMLRIRRNTSKSTTRKYKVCVRARSTRKRYFLWTKASDSQLDYCLRKTAKVSWVISARSMCRWTNRKTCSSWNSAARARRRAIGHETNLEKRSWPCRCKSAEHPSQMRCSLQIRGSRNIKLT